jgi:hypothetical protein
MKKIIAVASIVFVALGGINKISVEKADIKDIPTADNGRYSVEGYLQDTPNGYSLKGEHSSIKVNNANQEGYGRALINRKGNQNNLLEFKKYSQWKKVVSIEKQGTLTIYHLESGETLNENEIKEKKHILFKGVFVK